MLAQNQKYQKNQNLSILVPTILSSQVSSQFRFQYQSFSFHLVWSKNGTKMELKTRGGTGMKNQVLVGYRVFKKNQVRVESGLGPRKTLPENTCITSAVIHRHSAVIHRHKGLEYVSTTTLNFPWPQNLSALFIM